MDEELDNAWIDEFEKKESKYQQFYPREVKKINVYILYVNINCILDKVKKNEIELSKNNCLTQNELLKLLREKKYDDGISYKLISIIKHNVDLKTAEINKYLYNDDKYNFINTFKNLDDIYFNETIPIFEDLNSIYLIYYENNKAKQNKTKKIYIGNNSKQVRNTRKNNLKKHRIIK